MKKYSKKSVLKFLNIIIILSFMLILEITKAKAADDIVISKENWENWQQEDYWEWFTRETIDDKAYNGNHIVIEDDVINFYGYCQNSYKDFLYKKYENSGKKIFKFIIDESKVNYHTLDGAGFIFNSTIIDNKLSGYILLFGRKDISIYRIDNVDINEFQTAPSTEIQTYCSMIKSVNKANSNIHNLTIEVDSTSIKVLEEEKIILNVKLDYSKHVGNSFGLIASYKQHDCDILTHIEFYQFKILLQDYKISVLNTDTKGKHLTGGNFVIKDENKNIVARGKTNENGELIVNGLKEGIYKVQQTMAPTSYILNNNIYSFKVTNDNKVVDVDTEQEIELIVENEKKQSNITPTDNTIENDIVQNNIVENKKQNTSEKINTIKSNTTKDTTRANKIIPYTGEKMGKTIIISILIISSIFFIFKMKEYYR